MCVRVRVRAYLRVRVGCGLWEWVVGRGVGGGVHRCYYAQLANYQ